MAAWPTANAERANAPDLVENFIFTLEKLTKDDAKKAETLGKIFVRDPASYVVDVVVETSAVLAK